jgi:O-antigen ligase
MLVISVIAFGMGQIPWFVFANQAPLDAQAGGFAIFILSLGCTLVTAHLFQNIKWLKIIVWVYIALSAIYVLGRLIGLPVGQIYQIGLVSGSMFWTWLVVLAFAQAFFNNKLKLSVRALLYGVVLITMFVAYVRGNDWKSGWVPAAVAIAIMIGLRYKRLVLLTIPVAILAVGNLAVRLIASDEYSWGTRVDAWQIVFEISKVNPLFGLGFSNYYWYTPLIPIRGWVVNFNSHSQYIDLIAQVGILGLFCFLWIFFEVLKLSWRLLKNKSLTGFAEAYTFGVFAGVIETMVAAFLGDWVLPFVYNVGLNGFRASILPWIFIGGLVAIEKISTENRSLL